MQTFFRGENSSLLTKILGILGHHLYARDFCRYYINNRSGEHVRFSFVVFVNFLCVGFGFRLLTSGKDGLMSWTGLLSVVGGRPVGVQAPGFVARVPPLSLYCRPRGSHHATSFLISGVNMLSSISCPRYSLEMDLREFCWFCYSIRELLGLQRAVLAELLWLYCYQCNVVVEIQLDVKHTSGGGAHGRRVYSLLKNNQTIEWHPIWYRLQGHTFHCHNTFSPQATCLLNFEK